MSAGTATDVMSDCMKSRDATFIEGGWKNKTLHACLVLTGNGKLSLTFPERILDYSDPPPKHLKALRVIAA